MNDVDEKKKIIAQRIFATLYALEKEGFSRQEALSLIGLAISMQERD